MYVLFKVFLTLNACFHPQTGSTALFFASQQGHNEVVKLLFEFGGSTEFQTKVCCVTYLETERESEITVRESQRTSGEDGQNILTAVIQSV